ncbi:MAG TPA: hypothetical protein DDY31_06700 [Lachnospiraceae bacterium]|nr:hypothetical protein [Lachnospiraceae bacterium]
MGKEIIEKLGYVKNREDGKKGKDYKVLDGIETMLDKGDFQSAFRLFRWKIIGILCQEGVLEVRSPYYYRGGKLKEDKVAGEIIGAFEYYCASNGGYRSFKPHGGSFPCGRKTAAFIDAVVEFLKLLGENPGQDPWEVYCMYTDGFFDLENYLDKAGVYGFPHNRHSRGVVKEVLAPYAEKHYKDMSVGEFVDWYQAMDRVYTTHGFPFGCTHAGWFFEAYDTLYRNVFDVGAWIIREFWEHGRLGERIEKAAAEYPGILMSYNSFVKALQSTECWPLLCKIFPFRLTESTLCPGYCMAADRWEEFTLKLAKCLNFSEWCGRKKSIPEDVILDASEKLLDVLSEVRQYMESGGM